MIEGHMSPSQQAQFSQQLKKYPHIKTIAEIGLNAGHSAKKFFENCKNLQNFVSFDINAHPYTQKARKQLSETYGDKFLFIQGDSLLTIPELHQKFPKIKFDLIYIDGCHILDWPLGDILNGQKIAHEQTILWIDDVNPELFPFITSAVTLCETLGVIQVEEKFASSDPILGDRHWIQAKYLRT